MNVLSGWRNIHITVILYWKLWFIKKTVRLCTFKVYTHTHIYIYSINKFNLTVALAYIDLGLRTKGFSMWQLPWHVLILGSVQKVLACDNCLGRYWSWAWYKRFQYVTIAFAYIDFGFGTKGFSMWQLPWHILDITDSVESIQVLE